LDAAGTTLDAAAPTVWWCAHSSHPGKRLEGAGRTVGWGRRRSAGVEHRFQLLGVHDRVRVALLGEEALAVGRIVLVLGVAHDHGVEGGVAPVGLGRQRRTRRRRPLLGQTEGAADLHRAGGSGGSIEKFATLETTRREISPARNASNSSCRRFTGV